MRRAYLKVGGLETSEVYTALFLAEICPLKRFLNLRNAIWKPPRS
jgi:hypothetical protein